MRNFLLVSQIVVSLLLIGAILLQQKGVGLGSSFGGDAAFYRSRRGMEKVLFIATIVLAVLFIGGAILSLVIG